jgi:hypothetical protein
MTAFAVFIDRAGSRGQPPINTKDSSPLRKNSSGAPGDFERIRACVLTFLISICIFEADFWTVFPKFIKIRAMGMD